MEHDEWTERMDSTTLAVDEHDLEVAYYDEGSGDPVIFLHGIPTSSYLWEGVAPSLTDDYRVVVPDMVGYGESAMHDGFDRSIRAQEQMIDGLIQELGIEPVSFVGHDLGGGVGLRYAVHRPDVVSRLVLSNAVCYDSWPIETITELGVPANVKEMSTEDLQDMLEDLLRDTLADPESSDAFVEAILSQWDSEEAVVSLSRNAIGTNTSHTTEIDPVDVDAETLLLWGADDEFQPIEYAERLEEDVPDATLVGLDDAYHWVPEDRSETYREHLSEFLSQ